VATSGAHTLSFTGTTDLTVIDRSSYIDSVSVTAVPEPSTVALLTAGLMGLLAYAWRKWK